MNSMFNRMTHKSSYLALGLLLAFSNCVRSAPKKITETGVIQIKVKDAVFEKREVLIQLSQAIAHDATSQKFRASWGYNAASATTEGTVLYDRNRKTIKYWLRDTTEFGVHTDAMLYQDVTDEILLEIGKGFEEDINDFRSPQGNYYLDRLMEHKCKKIILKNNFVK